MRQSHLVFLCALFLALLCQCWHEPPAESVTLYAVGAKTGAVRHDHTNGECPPTTSTTNNDVKASIGNKQPQDHWNLWLPILTFDISSLSSPVESASLFIKCSGKANGAYPNYLMGIEMIFTAGCVSNPLAVADTACFGMAEDTTIAHDAFSVGSWTEIPLRADLFCGNDSLEMSMWPEDIDWVNCGVDLEVMENIAVPALRRAGEKGRLVVVDEIGRMELMSAGFREAVTNIIKGGYRVLGTIMLNPHPQADAIKQQPGVDLVPVTGSNNRQVLEDIRRWLKAGEAV